MDDIIVDKKISLYLLSGFLGAGKTTFLTNVLNDLTDEKVGVIMNEFGKIGIDGTLIARKGMELTEINRGSIFCSCLKNAFTSAMMEMADRDIQYLFVESSGLADPSNIGEVLSRVEAEKGPIVEYKGAICMVDGVFFMEQLKELETVERQLKHCHLAVISKADLVDHDHLSTVKDRVGTINPKIGIVEAAYGRINYDFLQEDLMSSNWAKMEESTNTPENKPKTIGLSYEGNISSEKLCSFLSLAAKDCHRIKGFCHVDGEWSQIDMVNERMDIKPSKVERMESNLVFLSKVGPNVIRTVASAWQNEVGREMKLSN